MAQRAPTKAAFIIIKCVSFILVFILLLSALSALFLPKRSGADSSIKNNLAGGFYGEPKDSLDIIAIGNSNIESGFSPMELWKQYGYTGYTCGEPYQNINEAYNLLSDVMTCQKPKVVILDVDGIFPVNRGNDTLYDFLDSNLNRLLPVIQYHNLWKTMLTDNVAQTPKYISSPTRGYLYSGLDKPFSGNRPKQHIPSMDKINAFTLFELNEFKNKCEENGAQLVLVYVPTAFSWDQKRHDLMVDYAAAHGLPYLDLNTGSTDFQISWRNDTRDGGDHLNYLGARDVTLFLGDYLHQHYYLTDHRTDAEFNRWNVDYDKYLKTVIR